MADRAIQKCRREADTLRRGYSERYEKESNASEWGRPKSNANVGKLLEIFPAHLNGNTDEDVLRMTKAI
jgi:hypothetical protein